MPKENLENSVKMLDILPASFPRQFVNVHHHILHHVPVQKIVAARIGTEGANSSYKNRYRREYHCATGLRLTRLTVRSPIRQLLLETVGFIAMVVLVVHSY